MDYLDAVLNGQAQSSAQIVNGPVAATGGDSVTYTIHVRGASGTPTGNVRLRLYGRVVGTGDLYGAGKCNHYSKCAQFWQPMSSGGQ